MWYLRCPETSPKIQQRLAEYSRLSLMGIIENCAIFDTTKFGLFFTRSTPGSVQHPWCMRPHVFNTMFYALMRQSWPREVTVYVIPLGA